jgi:hypothetical protein
VDLEKVALDSVMLMHVPVPWEVEAVAVTLEVMGFLLFEFRLLVVLEISSLLPEA